MRPNDALAAFVAAVRVPALAVAPVIAPDMAIVLAAPTCVATRYATSAAFVPPLTKL